MPPQTSEPVPPARRTILIVDDHALLRRGLTSLIESEPDLVVCGEAASCWAALDAIRESPPDLVIVDLALEGSDGLDLVKEMKRHHPDIPALVLSMHDEAVYAERALQAGAKGYIMKREPTEALVRAIRQVLGGEIAVSSHIVTGLTKKLSKSASLSPVDLLSDRELEVFRLFGEGRSRCEIADDLHLSVKTVEAHRAHIYEKLGLGGAAELRRQATHFVQDELRQHRPRGSAGSTGSRQPA